MQEFLTCPLHVTCEKLDFLPRKEHPRSLPRTWPFAHQSRSGLVVKGWWGISGVTAVSAVRGCDWVWSQQGRSRRGPLPPAFHLQGRHVTRCQQRGVCKAKAFGGIQ
ncbi:uncharacterized protein LOC111865580 isoform X2 [Cryptotermes secundus]|uniref:uncharacterized protein LOC111865580 isoform X1 n=1 Tax=Cryptotermes secundus TaxID=105785 RepID=UPI000CD7AD32|nr:uncharacterized protein LOC111865580 isoform X1 [Cryptotermes secundus]XP_023709505.1 uncharacterized protein LOC111865580 isoform X2 [Cryptotermes secundus]